MIWEIAVKLLICTAIFAFFFIGYGLTQLVGYRKIMCSCKARAYMEMRRRGVSNRTEAQNAPELINIDSNAEKPSNPKD